MKKTGTGIYLVLLLLAMTLQAFGNVKTEATPASGQVGSRYSPIHAFNLTPEPGISLLEELKNYSEEESYEVRYRPGKKTKYKFLVQNLGFRHLYKKSSVRLVTRCNNIVVVKTGNFYTNYYCIIRPAYYTFLFRLSPF